VATIALGATIYYALQLVVPPLAAAAITSLLFTVVALAIALSFMAAGHRALAYRLAAVVHAQVSRQTGRRSKACLRAR
jgi:hypothetical protein